MIYVVGDIQGCFKPFTALLKLIHFNPQVDALWLTGDLVNRGPDSLAVLRFLMNLPKPPVVVLGNHDLHLLAVHSGQVALSPSDTLRPVLEAPDSAILCDWLRQQPLVHVDRARGYAMVHAGLPPQWTVEAAQQYAAEVEKILKSPDYQGLFAHMYGKMPAIWDEKLAGFERLRFIINAITRIRFCTVEGKLDFTSKGIIGAQPSDLYPWFEIPQRASREEKILFGHWAALEGKVDSPNVVALDTGCVWGKELTAIRLEDQKIFQVACEKVSDINAH